VVRVRTLDVESSGFERAAKRGRRVRGTRFFRRRLFRYRMKQSMRKENCWDNAVAESFFATLKKELVRNHVFASHERTRSTWVS
jgi:transposase InsO family protein